jgi:hypothetical protein
MQQKDIFFTGECIEYYLKVSDGFKRANLKEMQRAGISIAKEDYAIVQRN